MVSISIWHEFSRVSCSKTRNCTSRFGECNFSYLKVQINFKLNGKNRIINNINMKKKNEREGSIPEDLIFQSTCRKFSLSSYVITLPRKMILFFSQS